MATKKQPYISRDGAQKSIWQNVLPFINPNAAIGLENVYDAIIIGSGITGLTAALLLQNAGRNILLADSHTIGFGTTGGTSAHINTFADTTHKEAESAFGKEGAQLFADAINEGFELIRSNIKNYRIECDYETKSGFYMPKMKNRPINSMKYFPGLKQWVLL
nr:FAD-dependent oxidoreductase [Mucilaginibacter glaciei]